MTTEPKIQITAEPQTRPDQCLFRIDRTLYPGTVYVSDAEAAAETVPIAKALFDASDLLRGVRIRHGEVLVTLKTPPQDWRELARAFGTALRTALEAGGTPVVSDAQDRLTGNDAVRARAQRVIDEELNPSLAAHGGWVEITDSEGNDIYINMGGGCQGCGSAAATMRQGVEVAIRDQVPEIGSIYDATNHAAGVNPYM
ncbi:MAG TPA: NifU family protein [Planctomycetota bacterium]